MSKKITPHSNRSQDNTLPGHGQGDNRVLDKYIAVDKVHDNFAIISCAKENNDEEIGEVCLYSECCNRTDFSCSCI